MLKNLLIAFFVVTTYVVGVFYVSSAAFAQDTTTGLTNDAPAGTTQTNDTTQDNRGFDWRWLLPLLAIPVILLFVRDERSDDRSTYRSTDLAGMKGGEASRERERDREEAEEAEEVRREDVL